MTTVAETMAQVLHQAGIKTVFGLPGGENAELLDAIRRQGIEFVLVRNESSAVFMADATARITGKPGVCVTTLGPGAANAYAGVAHAFLDRAPVLVITAQSIAELIGTHTHQVLDIQAIFRPVTKQTTTLTTIGTQAAVEQALALTMSGRPGPVHLGVSSEMAGREIIGSSSYNLQIPDSTVLPPQRDLIGRAQALLSRAKRPVIVAGLGLEPEAPYDALRELAEAANAPVIELPKSKGALVNDHPLSAGVIGLTRIDPAYEILDESDLILAVGFDPVELVKPWDQTQPLIWIAPWENCDPSIPAEVVLAGPMTNSLHQLSDGESVADAQWGTERVAAFRQKLGNQTLPEPDAGRMLPQQVLAAVRANVPRETLITTDVGSHKIFTGLNWPALATNRYMVSNGLSAMGFGVPAAAAAAKVLGRPTVCITGDAGMGMVIGELNMLTEHEMAVVIVIMNDSALDLIRSGQVRAGKVPFGTEFVNPDFCKIAESYGIQSWRVRTEEECASAVADAIATARPAIIDAQIDPKSYPTTPGYVQ